MYFFIINNICMIAVSCVIVIISQGNSHNGTNGDTKNFCSNECDNGVGNNHAYNANVVGNGADGPGSDGDAIHVNSHDHNSNSDNGNNKSHIYNYHIIAYNIICILTWYCE